ncbi:hypothetical protein DSO57_1025896 [Entomophthora muscae]|uniref:Uncharacterized protein n=1 Tax=Entomophthora muscae TaxID=34485 RepID=A0ACC2UNH6_9FUNG|nr:hypothetical protein DSO57_1025896 [Entomophthora muscae]
MYVTIDSATANKHDPTFNTKVLIPCVKPASQDAVVPAKGQHQLMDSVHEALLNCLNRGMIVWDNVSQFGVTAIYIDKLNKKYGNTGQIAKSTTAKWQPTLLQPVHIDAIKQWVTKDCHLDTLAVQSMLATEFGLSVSKTLVYKTMVELGFSWKLLGFFLYNRNSNKTIEDDVVKTAGSTRKQGFNQAGL